MKLRQLHILLLCLLALLSCSTPTPSNQKKVYWQKIEAKVNVKKPLKTFLLISKSSPNIVDSVYQSILLKLKKKEQNNLIIQHANFYQKLNANNKKSFIVSQKYIANAYYALGKNDTVDVILNKLIAFCEKNDLESELAGIYDIQADNQKSSGHSELSFKTRITALKLAEKHKDSTQYYSSKVGLAGNYYSKGETDKAIKNLLEVLSYMTKKKNTESERASIHSLLAGGYCIVNKLDSAILHSKKSIDIYSKIDDISGKGASYNHLGMIYMSKKEWTLAHQTLTKSIELLKDQDQLSIAAVTYNRGFCSLKNFEFEKAENDFLTCLDILKNSGIQNISMKSYYKLYLIASKRAKKEDALKYHILYSDLKDSLENVNKIKYIHQLLIQYDTEKKDKSIAELKLEKENEKQYTTVLILIVLIVSFVVIFLFFRNRKNQQLYSIQKKVRDQELLSVKNELDDYTENLVFKTELIEELENQINVFSSKNIKFPEGFLENLETLSKMKILTEDNWSDFQKHFEKVYPKLIRRITSTLKDLSAAELRLFLLIKLNISNKDMAAMLGISLDSIKKGRYRLKKKLNLDEKESLDDFVKVFQ